MQVEFLPSVLEPHVGKVKQTSEACFTSDAGRRRILHAYDFARNRVPGIQSHEEPAYWRDVGTLKAYSDAHNDVSGHKPRFELRNAAWPIHPYREIALAYSEEAFASTRGMKPAKERQPRQVPLAGRTLEIQPSCFASEVVPRAQHS